MHRGAERELAGGVVTAASPFHEGEQRVQERLGVREAIEPWARKVVRPFLPEEHRGFYGQLPFVVAAARDARGRPWATILAGRPGFLSSPDPRTLVSSALPSVGDALALRQELELLLQILLGGGRARILQHHEGLGE